MRVHATVKLENHKVSYTMILHAVRRFSREKQIQREVPVSRRHLDDERFQDLKEVCSNEDMGNNLASLQPHLLLDFASSTFVHTFEEPRCSSTAAMISNIADLAL